MFQSTPPAWGATQIALLGVTPTQFQSTPPAWGATSTSEAAATP